MATNQPEELLDLKDLSTQQIVDYLPGRYFKYKNKQYECRGCKLNPDGKKFTIYTYTNPVVIDYKDIGEISMVPNVILEKYTPKAKRKTGESKEYKERINYNYVMLVRIINKASNQSWADFAEQIGYPEYASALYQKYNNLVEKAKEAGLPLNKYVDSLKDTVAMKRKDKLNLKQVKAKSNEEIFGNNQNHTSNVSGSNFKTEGELSRYSTEESKIETTASRENKTFEIDEPYNSESDSNNESKRTDFKVTDLIKKETKSDVSESSYTNEILSAKDGSENPSTSQSEQEETITKTATEELGDIMKFVGKDLLYAICEIFRADKTWNKRRYYLQALLPDYEPFKDKDFAATKDKYDYQYKTTQEINFEKFLIKELGEFDQEHKFYNIKKNIIQTSQETIVDNKTTIKETSPLKNVPISKYVNELKDTVSELGDRIEMNKKFANSPLYLELLRRKKQLQQEMDHNDLLIKLYEIEHK